MSPRTDTLLRQDLARRGMRLTEQRRLILATVRGTESHPTAEWVHGEVRRRLPRVSLATVYRNLRLLARQGLLSELRHGPSVRFDARVERHHHFTCSGCGRIYDLEEPMDATLEAQVAAQTGFQVSHHRIEFYGQCAACLAGRALGDGASAGRMRHVVAASKNPDRPRREIRWPSRSKGPRATKT